MVQTIKLLIEVVRALVEALPQGTISNADYSAMIADGVLGVAKGAGFPVTGFTDAQVLGGAQAVVALVARWKTLGGVLP